MQRRITGTFWLDDIFCSAASRESMPEATEQIVALLRERHHLNPGEEDDFNVRRPEDVVQAQLATSRIMTILLTSVASLSLLVGGIGITAPSNRAGSICATTCPFLTRELKSTKKTRNRS